MRETITLYVPDGYRDAREFLADCQFEAVEHPADGEETIKRAA